MLAYALTSLDSPPELLEVPRPTPGEHDVLIRVQASSINPVDDLVATGFFRTVQEYRVPAVFGRDVCGVVEAVGDRVSGLRVGQIDRGIGFNVHSEPTPANLNAINALAEDGALRAPITAAYPFARIAEGFQRQREAGLGKTAVILDPALQDPQHAEYQAACAQGQFRPMPAIADESATN
jgi:NADPH:quinone reductase-like Zn-dependent oxidoreductase